MQRLMLCLATVAAIHVPAATGRAADPESRQPTSARVVRDEAAVRSGPAASCYVTATVDAGATVDVYARRADGWCAIRPPAGSFSWVYAQHVRPTGDGLAEVQRDEVPARVGSRHNSRRTEVQVHLRAGEIVEIVSEGVVDGGQWYKIAPPAGEFRWMHRDDLAWSAGDAEPPPGTVGVTPASHDEAADPLDEPDTASSSPADLPPDTAEADDEPPLADRGEETPDEPAAATDGQITPVGEAPSADVARQVLQLELRLSRMVAEPAATWDTASLQADGEQLLSSADSVADRQFVKATLRKVDRFAAIERRYDEVPARGSEVAAGRSAAPTTAAESQSPPASQAGSPDPAAASETPGEFDAVGVLHPVVSRRPGAPQFALVNEQGQVVSFVTPSPDVNLQPLVGKRVGVGGNRGYIPEFRRHHVTAGRVTPLDDRTLR